MLHIYTARVQGGRLLIDEMPEALKLSEGESVDLVLVDELLLSGGALSDEDESAALDRALTISVAEADAGLALDFRKALDDLRAHRRDTNQDGGGG